MNFNRIREMDDNELKMFIVNLSQKGDLLCAKCGNIIVPKKRYKLNISIYENPTCQKQRKLCSLCHECYTDLLDYLAVSDIDWDE